MDFLRELLKVNESRVFDDRTKSAIAGEIRDQIEDGEDWHDAVSSTMKHFSIDRYTAIEIFTNYYRHTPEYAQKHMKRFDKDAFKDWD